MGAWEDLANMGIRDPYDVARVAHSSGKAPVWIEYREEEPPGYMVTLLVPSSEDGCQKTKFGVWQHHSKDHALIAAEAYASNLAKGQSMHQIPGLRAARFPCDVAAMVVLSRGDWRDRAKTMTPHAYIRADDIAKASWPHVLDPCVCSLGRIAKPHRGG